MKNIFWLLFLLSIISGCETVVDIEIPLEKQELVVQSFITEDSPWMVFVSHSKHILDNADYSKLPNATVKIFEDDQELLQLFYDEKGYYSSVDNKPVFGKDYRLEVSAPGFETVTAQTTIPVKIPIKDIRLDTTAKIERDYSSYYKMIVVFDDPPGPDFYKFFVEMKEIYKRIVTVYDGTGYRDSLMVDSTYQQVDILAADPSLESEQYGEGILFDDTRFNGKQYSLEVFINNYYVDRFRYPYEENEIILTAHFQHINEEKFLYEKTSDIQDWNDGDPFAEPIPVFNNIENGLGIFAGYQEEVKLIYKK